MNALEAVEKSIAALPKDQRLTLAHRILKNAEPKESRSVDALWEAEIVSRIEKLDAGKTELFEASAVFKELDERLK